MNRTHAIPVVVAAALGFVFGAFRPVSNANQPDSRQQWEYGILIMSSGSTSFVTTDKFEGSSVDPLTELKRVDEALELVGQRGWELVTFERLGDWNDQELRWQFKRPLQ